MASMTKDGWKETDMFWDQIAKMEAKIPSPETTEQERILILARANGLSCWVCVEFVVVTLNGKIETVSSVRELLELLP